ncbi:metabotropic glutamate receptor-like [Gigantopelta aegis]|uniref:metabotropic glutamate receptor-like n=1 Tax=Gigantopelta aegis TaxID=1735272 RepID=UPI001B888B84|nr:metabotropic glutamate receptor-like [Gigantopelta aegis]
MKASQCVCQIVSTLLLLLILFQTVHLKLYIPGLPQKRYIRQGDINLGAIFSVYKYSAERPCGNSLRSPIVLQFIEAMVYAVERVNNDSSVLPNVSLGFVILDDCLKASTTGAQVLSFIPDIGDYFCNGSCPSVDVITSYDVVGVVGSTKSSTSIAAATILGPAQLPQISYSSTSDELSNKVLYPYFLRVVPTDEFQTLAMATFIDHYGWIYVSVVYSAGSYGELGYTHLKKYADEKGICIATAQKLEEGAGEEEYNAVAKALVGHIDARVVVVFSGPLQAKQLFRAIRRLKQERQFIWIGSDGWAKRIANLGEFWDVALGAFTFSFYSESVPEYETWFKAKRPLSETNPWFKEFWESHFKCSFSAVPATCNDSDVLSSANGFKPVPTVTPVMDAVYTFANALDRLLKDNCSTVVGSDVHSCINGPDLLQYLKTTAFEAENGFVLFDANGNILGKHIIEQLVEGSPYSQTTIGIYSSVTLNITFSNNPTWKYLNWTANSSSVPEAVCSKPCEPGEFRIQKQPLCCWSCKACRQNEILTENGTDCASCAEFYWPDRRTNYTTCTRIAAKYIHWGDILAILLVSASILGFVGTLAVFVFYVKHNSARCIKASSRELSYLMIAGIFVGYCTVAGLLAPPTDVSCKVNLFLFCLSCSWVYGPLLTRTIRIYRIFEAGKKSNKRPSFISSKAQFFAAGCLIAIQVVISTYVTIARSPTAKYSMPVVTERYVELSCDLDLDGWISFLVYNLLLVVCCSLFAFKTRKLPDNFNESRFISMCVYTTLVIWMAFIPSYFTAGKEHLKTMLLSIALLLNDTVAIVFLYLPKIYATLYVQSESRAETSKRSTMNFSLNTGADTAVSTIQGPSRGTNRGPSLSVVEPLEDMLPPNME